MLITLGLLVIGGAIAFWVYSTNKETFARPIKKITDIADINNDGKVNLEDVKTVATTVADNSSTMYNYNIGISVPQSNASSNDIARSVISQIKYIDSQRIRGQK